MIVGEQGTGVSGIRAFQLTRQLTGPDGFSPSDARRLRTRLGRVKVGRAPILRIYTRVPIKSAGRNLLRNRRDGVIIVFS